MNLVEALDHSGISSLKRRTLHAPNTFRRMDYYLLIQVHTAYTKSDVWYRPIVGIATLLLIGNEILLPCDQN